MNVKRHLFIGEDRARTIGSLAEDLGVSRREVEASIQEARNAGELVCSGSSGVWLAQTPQEGLRAADSLRERAVHQLLTSRAMRRSARAWASRDVEELTLWDEVA